MYSVIFSTLFELISIPKTLSIIFDAFWNDGWFCPQKAISIIALIDTLNGNLSMHKYSSRGIIDLLFNP